MRAWRGCIGRRNAGRGVRRPDRGCRPQRCREKIVERIAYERAGKAGEITVGLSDYVLVTLGSMTEASSLGTMDTAPVLNGKKDGGAWVLWEKIAAGRPEFGRPSAF